MRRRDVQLVTLLRFFFSFTGLKSETTTIFVIQKNISYLNKINYYYSCTNFSDLNSEKNQEYENKLKFNTLDFNFRSGIKFFQYFTTLLMYNENEVQTCVPDLRYNW